MPCGTTQGQHFDPLVSQFVSEKRHEGKNKCGTVHAATTVCEPSFARLEKAACKFVQPVTLIASNVVAGTSWPYDVLSNEEEDEEDAGGPG